MKRVLIIAITATFLLGCQRKPQETNPSPSTEEVQKTQVAQSAATVEEQPARTASNSSYYEEGEFYADFPGTPEYTSSFEGLDAHYYVFIDSNASYYILVMDIPAFANLDTQAIEGGLLGAMNGMLGSYDLELTERGDIEDFQGYSSLRFSGQGNVEGYSMNLHGMVLIKDGRFIQVFSMGEKNTVPENNLRAFVESFQIGK